MKGITIQKLNRDWYAGYIGDDNINHYVEHGKTKDELIRKLIEQVMKYRYNVKQPRRETNESISSG